MTRIALALLAISLATCAGNEWELGDGSPAEIRLCPGTCDAVSVDGDAHVELALGCATIPF